MLCFQFFYSEQYIEGVDDPIIVNHEIDIGKTMAFNLPVLLLLFLFCNAFMLLDFILELPTAVGGSGSTPTAESTTTDNSISFSNARFNVWVGEGDDDMQGCFKRIRGRSGCADGVAGGEVSGFGGEGQADGAFHVYR